MIRLVYYTDGVRYQSTCTDWDHAVNHIADVIDTIVVYEWDNDMDFLEGRLQDAGRLVPRGLFRKDSNDVELLINRDKLLRSPDLRKQLNKMHDVMWEATSSDFRMDIAEEL
jgi:hypothetical protein